MHACNVYFIVMVLFIQSHLSFSNVITCLQDVPLSSVKLLVVENLLLRPATDVYIAPFTVIHYSLERRKHGHVEGNVSYLFLYCISVSMTTVVTMPSDQYYFELTNETVARLDHNSSDVTALNIGYTSLVVQDRSILCEFIRIRVNH